jgi:ribosome-associated heat shock protein Hsp15
LLYGERIKPAKALKIGDELVISAGWSEYTVHVTALSDKRGPASEAAKLYLETPESREKRDQQAALRRANPLPTFTFKGRPTKRNRRKLQRLYEDKD